MIGFLSCSDNPQQRVKSGEILFVHIPDDMKKTDIRMFFAKKSKIFADYLNEDKVYLHFGKETIVYDYKV